MAVVGDVLTSPESGWSRFDGANSKVAFSGSGWAAGSHASYYNSTYNQNTSNSAIGATTATFKFYGTKVRLIGFYHTTGCNVQVTIDGEVDTSYSTQNASVQYQTLLYEKTGLTEGEHTISITNTSVGYYDLDAIDIDTTGYLITQVGGQLDSPESGWQRFDERASKIVYSGTWNQGSHASYYNSTYTNTNGTTQSINFKFYGTKLRVIDVIYSNRSSNVNINIDGTDYNFSENGSTVYKALVFEKTGLTEGIHDVTITDTTGNYWGLDAIDIDDTGSLQTVENQLYPTVDSEWTRVRDTDTKIQFNGTWSSNATHHYSNDINGDITFRFYGTRLRIVGYQYTDRSSNINVSIDGNNENFSMNGANLGGVTFEYEKTGLTEGIHDVVISLNTAGYYSLHAVEFDTTGELQHVDPIGEVLTSPEMGWTRVDDTNSEITYSGTWVNNYSSGGEYGGDLSYSNDLAGSYSFTFYGTALRLICERHTNRSTDINVEIDGSSESYNENGVATDQVVMYEKTGLTEGLHTVTVSLNSAGYYTLDAIDFNSGGYMADSAPIISITGNSKSKVSDETGFTTCTVSFQSNINIDEWEARADGTGHGTGLLVGAGSTLTASTTQQFDVTYDELTSGDKVYRINVYGKNSMGVWTPYS